MPTDSPIYCEVALPVPLERCFTYLAREGMNPQRGSRVIVPFRNEKLIGVITATSATKPEEFESRFIEILLDEEPILSEDLLKLGEWIASYYIAPLGEVLRTMLPLTAEVRRTVYYRITDLGRDTLATTLESTPPPALRKPIASDPTLDFANADQAEEDFPNYAERIKLDRNPAKRLPGAPGKRKGRLSAEELNIERKVLGRLASGEAVKVSTLRTATAASLPLLQGMLRKKWIVRETAAVERDARRMDRVAILVDSTRLPSLTEKQQSILAELSACGGELPLEVLRRKNLPSSTLQTLVRRNLVRIEERPAIFHMSSLTASLQPERLNEPQTEALASIASNFGKFQSFLLHGVTGSGKTAVYLAAMQRALDQGLSSILLVPEIGLTPQAAAQLDQVFGQQVALLHSSLTPDERSEQWRRIRRGEARIVVGTRSAIFAPAPNLGLILVDEEHDSSYKQEETPRYNARDVAVMRAKLGSAVAVLGSATPSLESWQNAASGKYQLIEMRDRVAQRPLPAVELIDMRAEFQQTQKENLFSRALISGVTETLDRGEQALILLNRRGYSFVVMCRACGHKLECENCAISLTHHKPASEDNGEAREGQRLECHYCGYRRTVPPRCPKCESEHLYYLGAGSQQGEEKLAEIFPNARIGRMDRDTIRGRHEMERLLSRLHSGEINLLVGTQMIAKGHDVHGVTLVGVVGCDHSLSMPDFRSAERVFQLMTQVSGRAGRGTLPGKVVVQTYHPDHYAIIAASGHNYHSFVERELKFRRWLHYPPFGVMANVLVTSKELPEAARWSADLGKFLVNMIQARTELTAADGSKALRVLGPCTAPIARIKNVYRFHMILKAQTRSVLNGALRAMLAEAERLNIPRRNLTIDVDAQRLM
jgi:primosomal protein N' (replication factor Y)